MVTSNAPSANKAYQDYQQWKSVHFITRTIIADKRILYPKCVIFDETDTRRTNRLFLLIELLSTAHRRQHPTIIFIAATTEKKRRIPGNRKAIAHCNKSRMWRLWRSASPQWVISVPPSTMMPDESNAMTSEAMINVCRKSENDSIGIGLFAAVYCAGDQFRFWPASGDE